MNKLKLRQALSIIDEVLLVRYSIPLNIWDGNIIMSLEKAVALQKLLKEGLNEKTED